LINRDGDVKNCPFDFACGSFFPFVNGVVYGYVSGIVYGYAFRLTGSIPKRHRLPRIT
jgi:hypothetical protein